MYDWQKKLLTDISKHDKIYIDLPRGIGKRKPMKVKDLIAKLKTMNPELPVISAKDDEWNGFKHTYSVDTMYSPDIEGYMVDTVYSQQDLNDLDYDDELNCVLIG